MGEVDDVEEPEDQGEADGEEEEEGAVGEPVEGLGEEVEGHVGLAGDRGLGPGPRSRSSSGR